MPATCQLLLFIEAEIRKIMFFVAAEKENGGMNYYEVEDRAAKLAKKV